MKQRRQTAMARAKEFTERILLSMPEGTIERIDSALEKDEIRLAFIRLAIEKELQRREKRLTAKDIEEMQRFEFPADQKYRLDDIPDDQ